VAPAGHCVWLAACSVKAFGCLPEPHLYSYQIMKLTTWGILHYSLLTVIHYVPFLFFFIKHTETQIGFSLISPGTEIKLSNLQLLGSACLPFLHMGAESLLVILWKFFRNFIGAVINLTRQRFFLYVFSFPCPFTSRNFPFI